MALVGSTGERGPLIFASPDMRQMHWPRPSVMHGFTAVDIRRLAHGGHLGLVLRESPIETLSNAIVGFFDSRIEMAKANEDAAVLANDPVTASLNGMARGYLEKLRPGLVAGLHPVDTAVATGNAFSDGVNESDSTNPVGQGLDGLRGVIGAEDLAFGIVGVDKNGTPISGFDRATAVSEVVALGSSAAAGGVATLRRLPKRTASASDRSPEGGSVTDGSLGSADGHTEIPEVQVEGYVGSQSPNRYDSGPLYHPDEFGMPGDQRLVDAAQDRARQNNTTANDGPNDTSKPPRTGSYEVVIDEGGAQHITGTTANGETIEVITEMVVEGDRLTLRNTHIDGSSPRRVGVMGLKDLARQLGKDKKVSEVVIEGARRTTGAMKGQIKRPITVKIDP